MSTVALLGELGRLGVKLWNEGEQLRYQAPRGALTAELKAKVIEHKGELVAFLRRVQSLQTSPTVPPIQRRP